MGNKKKNRAKRIVMSFFAIVVVLSVHQLWLKWAIVAVLFIVAFRIKLLPFLYRMFGKTYISSEHRVNKGHPLGDSRFETASESSLSTPLSRLKDVHGLIFGEQTRRLIYLDQNREGHTLVIGGTGEGKSVSHVIPTLLSWGGSAVVIDIKGELFDTTSQYRSQFGRVVRLNPVGSDALYNPIDACGDVFNSQDLARTLVPEPKDTDPFWAQSAQGILAAAIFEGNRMRQSLSDVAARCVETPIRELVENLSKSEFREVRLLASGFMDLPDNSLGGIAGEMRSKLLTLATDEDVARVTRRSDFTMSDLDEPMTLYLTIPESRLDQLRPLWTAIIQQVIRHLQNRPEGAQLPILMMLDEFPRLGKLPDFDGSLATLRSKNVNFSIVIQSMAQLDDRYGEDVRRIIIDNCSFKLILSSTDDKTQKALSNLAGHRRVTTHGYSHSSAPLALFGSDSENEQSVPLIRPEEFGRLGEDAILFQPRTMPMRIRRIRWYQHKALVAKVKHI